MSHTTTLKTVAIKSAEALQAAVNYLKEQGVDCELLQDAKPRMYYANQHGKCDYVLKLNNSIYDVGFDKQEDGSYLPVFDSWGGHIQNQIGMPKSCSVPKTEEERAAATVSRLLDCYAIHEAKRVLQESGSYYEYEVGYDATDGSYTLEATETYG
jgi:hypothetical protein